MISAVVAASIPSSQDSTICRSSGSSLRIRTESLSRALRWSRSESSPALGEHRLHVFQADKGRVPALLPDGVRNSRVVRDAEAPRFQRTSTIEHSEAPPELQMHFLAQVAPFLGVGLVTRGYTIECGTEFGDGSRIKFVLAGRDQRVAPHLHSRTRRQLITDWTGKTDCYSHRSERAGSTRRNSPCGHRRSQEPNRKQQSGNRKVRRIGSSGLHLVKKRGSRARVSASAAARPAPHPHQHETEPVSHNTSHQFGRPCSQRHADADFAGALRYGISQDAVKSYRGKE